VNLNRKDLHLDVFLETERLVLRRFTKDDVDHLFMLDNDPEVMRFINGGKPVSRSTIINEMISKILEYYRIYDHFGFWAAILKSDNTFIGWFHFRLVSENPKEVDLGYRLKKTAWNKGYATEGCRALISKGFEHLGIQKITAKALPMNKASIRVMEKAGMSYERKMIDESGNELVEYAIGKNSYLS